jgi:hypothetical protein
MLALLFLLVAAGLGYFYHDTGYTNDLMLWLAIGCAFMALLSGLARKETKPDSK